MDFLNSSVFSKADEELTATALSTITMQIIFILGQMSKNVPNSTGQFSYHPVIDI
jgi:hypothetical protein